MDKSVADVREEAVVAVPEASAAGGSDAPAPAVNEKAEVPEGKAKGDSPELTDQTNFLPTRQVCTLVVPCTLRSRTNAVSIGYYRIPWAIHRAHVLVLGSNHVRSFRRDFVGVERSTGPKSVLELADNLIYPTGRADRRRAASGGGDPPLAIH